MRMHPSLYPIFGLVQMLLEPQLLAKTLGTCHQQPQRSMEQSMCLSSSISEQHEVQGITPLLFLAGLVVMEILVPIFWLSDSLVEGHHKQVCQHSHL